MNELMDGLFDDLLERAASLTAALDDERELYATMLELAAREQHAIVRGDVETLTALTDEKEQLLELFAALETERMTGITAIAAATGQDASLATLSSLAAALPGDAAIALTSAGLELRQGALELRQANDRNAELLRNSRDIVERWIQYLRSVVSGTLSYNAGGQSTSTAGPRMLDRSA